MSTKLTEADVDPILSEIHRTRQHLLAEHGGLSGLARFLRKQDVKRESAEPNRKFAAPEHEQRSATEPMTE